MKSNKIILILYIAIMSITLSHAQNDTLNRYNSKGKKQGYWLCFLDEKFKKCDSLKGIYVGFDLYDNGQNLTRIATMARFSYNRKVDSLTPTDFKIKNYKILNGKVLFYDKKNQLIVEHSYLNGYPEKYFAYCTDLKYPECLGKISEMVDYTEKYNTVKGTFYAEWRSCVTNRIDKYWYIKKGRKWKSVMVN